MTSTSIVAVKRNPQHTFTELAKALHENIPEAQTDFFSLAMCVHSKGYAAVWLGETPEATAICRRLADTGLIAEVVPQDASSESHELVHQFFAVRNQRASARRWQTIGGIFIAVSILGLIAVLLLPLFL